MLAIQAQQLPQDHEDAEQHEAAEGPNTKPRKRSMPLNIDSRTKCATATPMPAPSSSTSTTMMTARRPGRHRRPGQQPAQMRRDQIGKMPTPGTAR